MHANEQHDPIPMPSVPLPQMTGDQQASIEALLDTFWETGDAFESVEVRIEAPDPPLAILEKLGSSPFAQSGFPLIGFLATTYDKVSRVALDGRDESGLGTNDA